ncbi:MAG: ABC transporter permease subunit [Lachnospiraceae bacterium]|jgi:ABC-2 type transport system permease protein
MKAIFKRELKYQFDTVTAPLYIAVLVMSCGIYFFVYNMNYGYPYFSYTLQSIMFIFTMVTPLLTMRIMAEDRRQKTDQLLLTSPATVRQIVLGKYFSMVAILAIPCLIFCLCPLIIRMYGSAHLGIDYASIFAFFMLGCTYLAIGLLISSLTENLIISAVATIGIFLLLLLAPSLAENFMPTTAGASLIGCVVILVLVALIYFAFSKNWIVTFLIMIIGAIALMAVYTLDSTVFENLITNMLSELSISDVLYSFTQYYTFDVAGIIKLVTISGFCLFAAEQTVQKRRWS